MPFIRATNTGEGFITHADQLIMTIVGVGPDVWDVSGDYQPWVDRVGGIPLTPEESTAMQNSIDNAPVIAQIVALESKQNRAVREGVLGGSTTYTTYLQNVENQIVALRATLK